MKLYLQFGDKMKAYSTSLIKKWGGGLVILSPRDLDAKQLKSTALEIQNAGGTVLLDPQCYEPKANHPKLIKHPHFFSDETTNYDTNCLTDIHYIQDKLVALRTINDDIKTDAYILPSTFCGKVSKIWLDIQDLFISQATKILKDKSRFATISLSAEVLRDQNQVQKLLNYCKDWDVAGFYIVVEHPNNDYLVDDSIWLSNLLDLCAGLRILPSSVIVGYCTHQMLYLGAANVTAIASGHWKNVRSFDKKKFFQTDQDGGNRQKIWYYCPQTLSEYKVSTLDAAQRVGVLEELRYNLLETEYSEKLFSGAPPSSTNYTQADSFKHYLHCLREQCLEGTQQSFKESQQSLNSLLDSAEISLKSLKSKQIKDNDRDFSDALNPTRQAIYLLEHERGFVLKRKWFKS